MVMLRGILEVLLLAHPVITSFISGFLSEDIIIFYAILAGKELIPFWIVITFGLLGILMGDSMHFLIGKLKIIKKLERKIQYDKKFGLLTSTVRKFGDKSDVKLFTLTKFVYGLRLASVMYLSARGMKFARFFYLEIMSTLIWAVIMIPAGWLVGKGFFLIFSVAKGIEKTLTFALLLFIIYYLFVRLISKYVMEYIKRS